MSAKNVVSWTAMIAAYVDNQKSSTALRLFRKMQMGNVELDQVTLTVALSACADLGALDIPHLHLPEQGCKTPHKVTMTVVYGTGVYVFRRHRVAEYYAGLPAQRQTRTGSNLPSSMTLVEIQRDRLTKIVEANLSKERKPFSADLVKEIYETELLVEGGRRTVPLQRVMGLEVGQYLENYL